VDSFETFPEQDEAKRLLRAAVAEGPAHAYLFHGPRGGGKRRAALAFAAELLGDSERVARGVHPDLYVLEPLGDQIRIDPIRDLRHDLHMRPFEADRRVYLVLRAHLLNEDAADALLKDLEEPPPYAVIVLVADELGLLPETIRSRCQPVPLPPARSERSGGRRERTGSEAAPPRVAADGWIGSRTAGSQGCESSVRLIELARGRSIATPLHSADASAALIEAAGEGATRAKAGRTEDRADRPRG
jgi:DNA polymerase-3 subunit delta'